MMVQGSIFEKQQLYGYHAVDLTSIQSNIVGWVKVQKPALVFIYPIWMDMKFLVM